MDGPPPPQQSLAQQGQGLVPVTASQQPPRLSDQSVEAASQIAGLPSILGDGTGNAQGTPKGPNLDPAEGKFKGPSLSYATRVSPATINWLIENYETAEGVSLPRSTLYSHYQRHW